MTCTETLHFNRNKRTLTVKELLSTNHILLHTLQLLINIKLVFHLILSGIWAHDSCHEVAEALDCAITLTDVCSEWLLGTCFLTMIQVYIVGEWSKSGVANSSCSKGNYMEYGWKFMSSLKTHSKICIPDAWL